MISLIDILISGVLLDWRIKMVIRGTPKDVENYITVKDNYIIYKLSEQGVFPIYIDSNLAYFEDKLTTIALITLITEQEEEG